MKFCSTSIVILEIFRFGKSGLPWLCGQSLDPAHSHHLPSNMAALRASPAVLSAKLGARKVSAKRCEGEGDEGRGFGTPSTSSAQRSQLRVVVGVMRRLLLAAPVSPGTTVSIFRGGDWRCFFAATFGRGSIPLIHTEKDSSERRKGGRQPLVRAVRGCAITPGGGKVVRGSPRRLRVARR